MFGAACFQQQTSEAIANHTNVLTSAVVDSFGPSGPEFASVIESRRDVGWSVFSGTEPTIAFTCVSHVSLRPSDVKFSRFLYWLCWLHDQTLYHWLYNERSRVHLALRNCSVFIISNKMVTVIAFIL